MRMQKTLLTIVMSLAATAVWAAKAATESPPSWPWPEPMPSKIRDALEWGQVLT
jgi:hypothetical protein